MERNGTRAQTGPGDALLGLVPFYLMMRRQFRPEWVQRFRYGHSELCQSNQEDYGTMVPVRSASSDGSLHNAGERPAEKAPGDRGINDPI